MQCALLVSKTTLSVDGKMSFYSSNYQKLIQQYDALDPKEVHAGWLSLLPQNQTIAALDIGAGSGRDARWLAAQGYEVIAIEPAAKLREAAQRHPDNKGILWIDDKLPDLPRTTTLGIKYDLILVSAVWMHIHACARERAFRKLVNLLNNRGKLVITLRHGDFSDERIAYPVSVIELKQLATQNVLQLIMENQSPDRMGRKDVSWATIVFQRQDNGTSAVL